MQSANLSGPFRGCLYYALLGLPQATGLAGGYDLGQKNYPGALPLNSGKRIENLLILYYNVTNCSFLRDKLDG